MAGYEVAGQALRGEASICADAAVHTVLLPLPPPFIRAGHCTPHLEEVEGLARGRVPQAALHGKLAQPGRHQHAILVLLNLKGDGQRMKTGLNSRVGQGPGRWPSSRAALWRSLGKVLAVQQGRRLGSTAAASDTGPCPHTPIRAAQPRTSWKRPWLAEMKKVPWGRRCAIQWCPLAVSRYLERGEEGES